MALLNIDFSRGINATNASQNLARGVENFGAGIGGMLTNTSELLKERSQTRTLKEITALSQEGITAAQSGNLRNIELTINKLNALKGSSTDQETIQVVNDEIRKLQNLIEPTKQRQGYGNVALIKEQMKGQTDPEILKNLEQAAAATARYSNLPDPSQYIGMADTELKRQRDEQDVAIDLIEKRIVSSF